MKASRNFPWNTIQKAQTDATKYTRTTVANMNTTSGYPKNFDYNTALSVCKGFLYAIFMMNARKVASQRLKAYARKSTADKLFTGKSVSHLSKSYLAGDKKSFKNKNRPNISVINKLAEWNNDYEEIVDGHQILSLLSRPNKHQSGTLFMELSMMYLQITGNSYWHPIVETANGFTRFSQLYQLPSQYCDPIPAAPNSGELVSGYKYGVNGTAKEIYTPDEVLHLKLPNLRSPILGAGLVEQNWPAIQLSLEQRATDLAKYQNQSLPVIVVNTKSGAFTEGNLIDLQNKWADDLLGSFNAGKPAFTTGDTTIEQLEWAPFDPGEKTRLLEELASVGGVPVALVLSNDPNLASAQVAHNSWLSNTICYYCSLNEDFFNNDIVRAYGLEDDVILAYEDPIPESESDMRENIKAFKEILSIDEQRQLIGLEALHQKNSDKVYISKNVQPLEMADEAVQVEAAEVKDNTPEETNNV